MYIKNNEITYQQLQKLFQTELNLAHYRGYRQYFALLTILNSEY